MKHNYRSSKKKKRKKEKNVSKSDLKIQQSVETGQKKCWKKEKMLMLPNFMCHNTIVIKVILWFTSLSTAEQQDSLVTMLTIAKKKSLTITQYKECEWRISAIVSCSCDQLYKKREREREQDQQPSSFLEKNLLNTK